MGYPRNSPNPPPLSATVVSSSDGSPITSGVAAKYAAAGAAQGAGSGTATHQGNGQWSYLPTQAETAAAGFAIQFYHASAVGTGPTVSVVTEAEKVTDEPRPVQSPVGRLLARCPHTVNWAQITDPASGTANWGSGGAASIWTLLHGHACRIRQTGDITRVKFYWAVSTNVSVMKVQVWREVRSNVFDLVGESRNLISELVAAQVNTLDLSPIAVREGDYVGVALTVAGASDYQMLADASTGENLYYTLTDPGVSAVAWESKTPVANLRIRLQVFGRAPHIVGIGDSIMTGGNGHRSFLQTTDVTDVNAHITLAVAEALGGVGQNMGFGSQTTTDLAARITTDCVNLRPRIAILQGGVNDISGGVIDQATFLANWTTMLNACQAAGIEPVVCLIQPWTAGTTEQMQTRDLWNAALAALAADYPDAVVVDFDSYVGTNRVGGDAGNKWDIAAAYSDGDGVHFNSLGYARMAQAVLDALAKRGAVPQPAAGATGGLALHGESAGTGARTVTITVNDGTDPLESVKVRLTKGAESYVATSNVSGVATLHVDDGSWAVVPTLSGYTHAGATLVVDGDEAVTYSMTQITFPASNPGMVTGYLYCYDENGVVESAVTVEIRCYEVDGNGLCFDTAIRSGTSDAAGLVTFSNLVPGGSYQIRRGTIGRWTRITIPADATDPYALEDIGGED